LNDFDADTRAQADVTFRYGKRETSSTCGSVERERAEEVDDEEDDAGLLRLRMHSRRNVPAGPTGWSGFVVVDNRLNLALIGGLGAFPLVDLLLLLFFVRTMVLGVC